MPQLESQESRNNRLIHLDHGCTLQDIGADLPLNEQWKDKDLQTIREAFLRERYMFMVDKYGLSVRQAWLLGGMAAAQRLVESDLPPVPEAIRENDIADRKGSGCVKKAWGRGDEAKARALVKVFTLQMISYWFRNADRWQDPESVPPSEDSDITDWFRNTDNQKLLPEYMRRAGLGRGLEGSASLMLAVVDSSRSISIKPRSSLENVSDSLSLLGVFGKRRQEYVSDVRFGINNNWMRDKEDIKDFLNIDRQWNRECQLRVMQHVPLSLLLAKALEACGQRCVDWNTVPFPVKSMQQLVDESTIFDHRPFDDFQELLLMMVAIDVGVWVTRERYHYLVTKAYGG